MLANFGLKPSPGLLSESRSDRDRRKAINKAFVSSRVQGSLTETSEFPKTPPARRAGFTRPETPPSDEDGFMRSRGYSTETSESSHFATPPERGGFTRSWSDSTETSDFSYEAEPTARIGFTRLRGYTAGMSKNLRHNPLGNPIPKVEPSRQRKVLLVRDDLTAVLGKRRSKSENCFDMGIHRDGRYKRLIISDGKLKMKEANSLRKAYEKNLDFFLGGKKSCMQLRYVAYTIAEIGISRKLFMRMRYASHLFYIGKSARAYQVVRSVAGRCAFLRRRSEPVLTDWSHPSNSAVPCGTGE